MALYEIKCDVCKTTIGRTDSMRQSAAGGRCSDHPYPDPDETIAVHISPDLAMTMIEAVGGERDERGQFVFPDGSPFWLLSEATEYALKAMPTVVFDEMASG